MKNPVHVIMIIINYFVIDYDKFINKKILFIVG